jgi:hypothetical protein
VSNRVGFRHRHRFGCYLRASGHCRVPHQEPAACMTLLATDTYQQRTRTLKAVVYNGPRDVSVKNVPDARIEQPNRPCVNRRVYVAERDISWHLAIGVYVPFMQ